MSFTARGYAILNEKLRPDIAVLEGGYSVETALPYINMGIIMAMAGIDYSNLREPDYSEHTFRESPENMKKIKELVKLQLETFRSRDAAVERYREKGRVFATEQRSIFYDTDGIRESQQNNFRICPDCCGFRLIESGATQRDGSDYHVFCISLPAACCQTCSAEAYQIMEQVGKQEALDFVFLQDRIKDEFHILNPKTGEKSVI